MFEFRTLDSESPARRYAAFMEAFSDYSVPVAWSEAEFDAANARRGADWSLSLGAYEGGRLVGFVMSGSGEWGGRKAAYDMGTGVVPSARGSGLAGLLAERLKGLLAERGVGLYLLEVIRDNAPALKTYERAGFRKTRDFECSEGTFVDPGKAPPEGVAVGELAAFPRAEAAAMRDWEPSWQNSDASVARNPTPLVILGAREASAPGGAGSGAPGAAGAAAGRLLGYAVASPSGTIWQLAVAREARRRGIGTALLRGLAARTGGALRYINAQSDDAGTRTLLARSGIREDVGQYEMTLELE